MTKILQSRLAVSLDRIAALCDRHEIQELALFGSALRDDFNAASDLDLLVTFRPEARIGLLKFSRIRREFEELLARRVDLVPKEGLKPAIRDEIITHAEPIYAL